jgi:hypothetical protein
MTNQTRNNKKIHDGIDDLIILLANVNIDNYAYPLTEELLVELVSTKRRLIPEFLKEGKTK